MKRNRLPDSESDESPSPWAIWLLVGFLVLWGATIFVGAMCAMVVCVR